MDLFLLVRGSWDVYELCFPILYRDTPYARVELLHLQRPESQQIEYRLWVVGQLIRFEFIYEKIRRFFMLSYSMAGLFMILRFPSLQFNYIVLWPFLFLYKKSY